MRTATSREMAAIDRETIDGGVPGAELMERAGRGIVRATLDLFPGIVPPARVAICCGKGNNGGDGLVIARLLDGLGFRVAVMLLAPADDLSPDARLNRGRLPSGVEVATPPRAEWADRWRALAADADLVVDAVFGTGIRPPLRDPYPALLSAFADLPAPIVAVDIPSGVSGDDGAADPAAVRADATATVGLPKLGLLLPPGRDHVGELAVVDIGFADDVVARHAPARHHLLPGDYARLLPERPGDAHKYRCGTVLVLAGSRAFGGAAVLAGMGALRSGVGLVTVAAPDCLETPLRANLPEALIAPLPSTDRGTVAPPGAEALAALLHRKRAVAVGPGMGDDPRTDDWLIGWLARSTLPVVVDADALSAFGRRGVEPRFASGDVVLTPHAGELGRMIGTSPAEIEANRLELVPELAARWGATLLLKGSPAVIADPEGSLWLNPSGDDALAHGGTGDVLTGLVAGLLGQGLGARDAALLGAYLHGRAGAIAAGYGSRRTVLAREVAEALGEAFADLEDPASGDAGQYGWEDA